jgi:uncharacterized membrane protein
MTITYAIIFILAAIPFLEIAAIIPIAIVGGLPAIPVMITALLGNLVTIILLILFIDKIRTWRQNRKKDAPEKSEKKNKRAKKLWDKYGLVGLTFLGPFFVGSHLSALLAVTFGGTRKRTLTLMTASLCSWTIILGIAALYGFDFFIADEDNLGVITRMIQQ